jgi:catechol 2,3-dioxygenase
MSDIPFAATAPVSVARVGLRARDAERLAEYYRAVVGLAELSRRDGAIVLGSPERPLLVLEPDPSARPDDPRSAGLFHTAFLLPSRADLGRWVKHAIGKQIPIDGASDHLVSEALYLTDPEGNGIEIYADRPRGAWSFKNGGIEMATIRLNIPNLVAEVPAGDPGWKGAPENSVVGHVHLRVGNPAEAEKWWRSEFGFDTMAHYGSQAVFLSTGGYHHHIGANSWQSAGAGRRDPARSGLAWVELSSRTATGPSEHVDPWGTVIRQVPTSRPDA